MLADLSRPLRLIPKHRRWQWAALVPLAIAAAVLESLGAGVVLALGTVVANPDSLATLPLVARFAPHTSSLAPRPLTLVVTAGALLFYVLRGVLLTSFVWVQETIVHRTAADVAARVYRAYLRAPYVFHLRRHSATLIQTVSQSADYLVQFGLGSAVKIVTEGLTLAGLVLVLAIAAPLSTLASTAAVGVLLIGLLFVTRRLAPRLSADVKHLNERLQQDLQQGLASFKEVRVMGAEPFFEAAFATHRVRAATLRARQDMMTTATRVSVETIFVVAILFALLVVVAGGASGDSLVGVMTLYAYAGFRVVPSANRLVLNIGLVQRAQPHIAGICRDLDAIERTGAVATLEPTTTVPARWDRLELDSVSYAYDESRGPALHDVSLTIRSGESIGIVGATGAGKSTLLDLMLGLLEPRAGRVLVDGQDIRGDVRAWHRHIGYVPQAFTLLDDTLRRNIAFGLPDETIDDTRVEAALRLAHLEQTVASLPDGLHTRVGERAVRLSGGERQRVAVARALYHDPDVLVFDEATSALDYQTEQAIIAAIDELRGIKTLVVVAHRLSTGRGCDRLVVLEHGRVTGEGSYETLVALHPAFRALVSAAGSA